jgi:hypothetical protein
MIAAWWSGHQRLSERGSLGQGDVRVGESLPFVLVDLGRTAVRSPIGEPSRGLVTSFRCAQWNDKHQAHVLVAGVDLTIITPARPHDCVAALTGQQAY